MPLYADIYTYTIIYPIIYIYPIIPLYPHRNRSYTLVCHPGIPIVCSERVEKVRRLLSDEKKSSICRMVLCSKTV